MPITMNKRPLIFDEEKNSESVKIILLPHLFAINIHEGLKINNILKIIRIIDVIFK